MTEFHKVRLVARRDTDAFGAMLDAEAEAFGLQITVERFDSAAEAEQAVDDGELAAALLPGPELVTAALSLGAVLATGLVDLPPGTMALLAQVVLWFVLGYAFYSCAFAMTGAIVPRQEELQNAMTPLMMVIFVSFFAAFAALQHPAGQVAGWEIAVALTGTLALAVALVPLAGRVYTGAVLRTGSRVKLRHALAAGR